MKICCAKTLKIMSTITKDIVTKAGKITVVIIPNEIHNSKKYEKIAHKLLDSVEEDKSRDKSREKKTYSYEYRKLPEGVDEYVGPFNEELNKVIGFKTNVLTVEMPEVIKDKYPTLDLRNCTSLNKISFLPGEKGVPTRIRVIIPKNQNLNSFRVENVGIYKPDLSGNEMYLSRYADPIKVWKDIKPGFKVFRHIQ